MAGALLQDARYALRSLTRSRGFATVAVLTLALGIGANTAIFGVIDAVLLRPLPFHAADRLVRVTSAFTRQGVDDVGLGVAELFDVRDRADVFEEIAGLYPINANLTGGDEPERVETELVSANYFTLLGVRAQIGRLFDVSDYDPGNATVAVISDTLWKRRFGSRRDVIGTKVRLDNDLFELIGVLPASFHHPGRGIRGEPELFSPSGYIATPFPSTPPRGFFVLAGGLARLKPGVSIDTAQRRLNELSASVRAEHPKDYPDRQGWQLRLVPLQQDLVGRIRPALLVLLAAVSAVLLIACANVANLLLARATQRQKEFAIRGALGATRSRLIRQLLTESVVLALAGGAAGLLCTRWLLLALTSVIPEELPRASEIALGLDARVLAFSLGLSLATGLIFGLWPALQASPAQPYDGLKESGRSMSAGPRRTRVRGALVVTEFALSLVLLVTAMLLVRSFVKLYDVETGFSPDRVLTARLWMPQPNDPKTGPYFTHVQRAAFYHQALERIRNLSGVEHAGWVTRLPMGGGSGRPNGSFLIEGQPPETAVLNAVEPFLASPGYFEGLSTPLIRGRLFDDHDNDQGMRVALLSESAASKYFPNDDPVGKRIRPGGPNSTAPWLTVVGVVRDIRSGRLDAPPPPQMYQCVWQVSGLSMALVVKTRADPGPLARPVQAAVHAVDPELPLYAVEPMNAVLATSLAQRRFLMTVIGVFAALALLLSSIGIYGVLAYLVQQRTAELGVRIALGADPMDIRRLVISEGLKLAAIGIGIGLIGALFATRAVADSLFGVGRFDPVSFAGIAGLLTLVAVLACYLPARRATRIDPLVALRQE